MGRLNLADWIDCTEVEGPGKRFALWVQGCTLRCPGCCNAHMFELVPNRVVDTDAVLKWVFKSQVEHNIEGVTFLGGEPMLQAQGLSIVAARCREHGLSVMVFSGYTLEFLKNEPMSGVLALLEHTDILVDGPFIAEQLESRRNWAGSANQRFHFLTDRYSSGIEWDPAYSHGFELRCFPDGTVRSNGWPSGINARGVSEAK